MPSAHGRFITLEGGEGAGKSTQIRLLAEALRKKGLPVVTTREPGGSEGAEAIRSLLVSGATDRWDSRSEALLHMAARRDHLVKSVWPALADGKWVVCDRFVDSTVAYQGFGLGVDRGELEELARFTMGDFAPDLTFILDLPVEAGLARAGSRGGGEDRYERMGQAFHQKLRDGFLEIARRNKGRCVVLDATESVEAVQRQMLDTIVDRYLR
jgi:dTMP kinase